MKGITELIALSENDFDIVTEIYNYYVRNSTATFHIDEVQVNELKEIIRTDHPKYKSFLIKYEGSICGYCYLSQYKKRQAYDRTAEITIYISPEFTGKGIGKQTVEKLENVAIQVGIKVLVGIISGDNEQSINLFKKCGYEKCAHFKQVGEKFNKILDVFAYQKIIG